MGKVVLNDNHAGNLISHFISTAAIFFSKSKMLRGKVGNKTNPTQKDHIWATRRIKMEFKVFHDDILASGFH